MTNHYHVIVDTPDPNRSIGVRQLNGLCRQLFIHVHYAASRRIVKAHELEVALETTGTA
jgi:hypothetical protein